MKHRINTFITILCILFQQGAFAELNHEGEESTQIQEKRLIGACIQGRTETVQDLLESGVNPNAEDGMALAQASFKGHIEIVRLLLQYRADPNALNGTALFIAVSEGYTEIAGLLLEYRADPKARNGDAFLWACLKGYIETVQLFLKKGADPNVKNGDALVWTADSGDVEIVRILLENGVDPNAQDGAPLSLASSAGHVEIVRLLLQYKADPNLRDGAALIGACHNGHPEIVRILLEHKANPNAGDRMALHAAATCYGNEDGKKYANFSPEYCPSSNKNKEVLQLLLEYGADPEGHAEGMLFYASGFCHTEIVEILLKYRVNPNAPTVEDPEIVEITRSPRKLFGLHLEMGNAVFEFTKASRQVIINFFLENVLGLKTQGGLPLIRAVESGCTENVELLLKHGADPEIRNGEAFDKAFIGGHTEIIDLLRKYSRKADL